MTRIATHCLTCGYPHLVDPLTLICKRCEGRVKRGSASNRGLAQPEPEEEPREVWFARRARLAELEAEE